MHPQGEAGRTPPSEPRRLSSLLHWPSLLAEALLLGGVGALAAGLMLLQFAATRVFATLYPYTLVFPLVTAAAGGVGLGGFVAHRLLAVPRRFQWLPATLAGLGGLAATAGIAFILATTRLNAVALNWLGLLLSFAGGGAALGAAFTLGARRGGTLAAIYLAGGALAAAAAVPAFDLMGTERAALLPGGLLALGALSLLGIGPLLSRSWAPEAPVAGGDWARTWQSSEPKTVGAALDFDEDVPIWHGPSAQRVLSALVAVVTAGAVVLVALWQPRLRPEAVSSPKALYLSIQSPDLRERPVFSAWNGVARTDVTDPATAQPIKWVYTDGSGASLMYRLGADDAEVADLRSDLGYVPFVHPQPAQKVLLLGIGGGQEVLQALLAGASEVTAVEPNPGIVQALRHSAGFNGELLGKPGVRIVVDEGRSFLRRTSEQYDVIYLGVPASLPEHGFGWALGQDFRLTADGFGEYLRRLRPGGRVALRLRDQAELLRAWTTAFTAVTRTTRNPLEALRHMLAVNDSPAAQRRQVPILSPLLVVRNSVYSEEESAAATELLQQLGYEPIHVPHREQPSPLTYLAVEDATIDALQANLPFNVRPPSDGQPFFYEFGRGFPGRYALLLAGALATAGLAAVTLRRRPPDDLDAAFLPDGDAALAADDDVPWRFVLFFAATGAGFALAQVPLTLRLQLLIGHPTTAAAATTTLLLGSAALGSLFSQRFPPRLLRPIVGWATLAAGLLLIAELELLPMVTQTFGMLPLSSRIGAAALAVAPLGLALGVPFASGIRMLEWSGRGHRVAQMWGISGFAATAGAALAMLLGIRWGLAWPWALAAGLYLAVFLMAGLRQLEVTEAPTVAPTAPDDHEAWRRPAVTTDE